jgi:hypothetical protein
MKTPSKDLDSRARRVARAAGLVARKSTRGLGSIDNLGGYMLIDGAGNFVVAGSRFDLSAADVIEYCAG